MKWFRKQQKKQAETMDVQPSPYRELRPDEIDAACALGESGSQSMLAVHLARTMRDNAILEMRNILRKDDLKGAPDVQQGMLIQAAARMDAAIEWEEEWGRMFAEWRERARRDRAQG